MLKKEMILIATLLSVALSITFANSAQAAPRHKQQRQTIVCDMRGCSDQAPGAGPARAEENTAVDANGGALVPGNKADLIVVDLNRAHLVPVLRVVSDFVHQGQGRDIEAVMVDGRWIMRDGTILTMDEERIVAEAQRLGKLAWRRLFESRPDLEVPGGFAPC